MTMKNADNLIVSVEMEKLGKTVSPVAEREVQPPVEEVLSPEPETPLQAAGEAEPPEQEAAPEPEKTPPEEPEAHAPSDDPVDEYGNKVARERVYTQDEVNRMIRERIARGKQPDPVQQTAPVEPNATEQPAGEEESWQTQLRSEINNVVTEREKAAQHKAWKDRQMAEQAEFEHKFESGAQKYSDFESVVVGKPLTASMMVATKGMQDPAAFIYAACKNQPAELERIAKIADPYAQVAEMARLEANMRKPKAVSAAPKPVRRISGDTTNEMPKQSIDQLIAVHAREKIMTTRRLK